MERDEQETYRLIVQRRLTALEAELAALQDATEAVVPDVAIGRLSRLDAMQQQQMALAGRRRLEEERARLREALPRIDTGAYGRCLLCGADLARERLEYQPEAVTCVPCLRKKR